MGKDRKSFLIEKRNEILQASTKVFVKKGFFLTQMEDIAREAGIAKGTIYLYFKSKEELFCSFFENIFEQSLLDIEKIKNISCNAIEKIKMVIKNQLEFCQKNIDLFIMIDREFRHMEKTLRMVHAQKIMKKYEKIIYSISEIIGQGIKEKLIKKIDPILISFILIDMVKSTVLKNVKFKTKKDLIAQMPTILEIFLNGVGMEKKQHG